jgi:hypothetical protein
MYAVLTVVRYPSRYIYFAICAMALFRIPLARNKHFLFYKLMGCGKNGSFDIHPDWNQWAILVFVKERPSMDGYNENADPFYKEMYGSFIANWWRRFNCERWSISLELTEGHGSWDGQKLSPVQKKNIPPAGPVAVLTRATIRLHKLRDFWKNVEPVARQMQNAPGLISSLGVGELPFIRQATFSIWESTEEMKKFAYSMQEHREVIKKTRKENWYSEDMFLRFRPISSFGSLKGRNPWPGQ